jgi:UDP-glucuronate decarboxylase
MLYNKIVRDDCYKIIENISLHNFKKKNILILGSNSFLASYISAVLAQGNAQLNLKCNVDCISKNNPHSLFDEIYKENKKFMTFSKINLENIKLLKNKIYKKKYHFIFHCATYAQPEKWLNNLSGTIFLNTILLEELIRYSIKFKSKLMYFSSVDVYSDNKNKIIQENHKLGHPNDEYRSIYSLAKILGEQICKIYKKKFNFKTYIVRAAHTYGPGQSINDRRFISQTIKRALIEKKVYIYGSGKSVKTWGYIAEIASMILNIIQFGKSDIYNLTAKNYSSIEKIAKIIAKETKVKFEKKKIGKNFVSKDYSIIKISSKKYHNEFIKKPISISIHTGLKRFLEWSKISIKK